MRKEIILAITTIIFSIMLLICWYDSLPWLYFQLLRNIGIVVFALIAYINYSLGNIIFAIIFSISVLIIQPFIKVPMGRYYWNIIDTIWAIILIVNTLIILKNPKL